YGSPIGTYRFGYSSRADSARPSADLVFVGVEFISTQLTYDNTTITSVKSIAGNELRFYQDWPSLVFYEHGGRTFTIYQPFGKAGGVGGGSYHSGSNSYSSSFAPGSDIILRSFRPLPLSGKPPYTIGETFSKYDTYFYGIPNTDLVLAAGVYKLTLSANSGITSSSFMGGPYEFRWFDVASNSLIGITGVVKHASSTDVYFAPAEAIVVVGHQDAVQNEKGGVFRVRNVGTTTIPESLLDMLSLEVKKLS
ncbi:MAG: hypothetical protein D6698_00855, partial [Gammaproteobacteria bacterium]